MKFIADLHIHSKYSRATSKDMTLEELDRWADDKGILVIATGDFTHPDWFKEIKEKLEPAESGLFKLKPQYKKRTIKGTLAETRFFLSTEISSIYSKHGSTRIGTRIDADAKKVYRIHNLVFAPDIETVEKINTQLGWIGNLKSDGRPILGLDAQELVKIVLNTNEKAAVIPAHCLLPDTLIHTRDNLLKPIKDIQKGDYVITHKNRWRKVTEIFKRPYNGKVYHIKPRNFSLGLITTPEHPFYAIKTYKNCHWSKGICKPSHIDLDECKNKYFKNYKPQWLMASQLERGDVLIFPRFKNLFENHQEIDLKEIIDQSDLKTEISGEFIVPIGNKITAIKQRIIVNKDFCRLAGYYLAEGYVNGRDLIGFAFNNNEKKYIEEVIVLMKKVFGFDKKPKLKINKNDGIEILFYSKILYETFRQLFYSSNEIQNASTKALPDWMLGLPTDLQVEIFRCWWRGDNGYTASRLLMNQMKIILLRLGIVPSIYVDKKDNYNTRPKHFIGERKIKARYDIYSLNQLSFYEDKFNLLQEPEFAKVAKYNKGRKYGWIDDDYIYLPIYKIEIKNYKGEVYNLEVKEDNSYTCEFATVHNCWTPWFSVFGSMSGFDSLEECFGDYAKYIFAGETGLSSDPAMNWRLSQLDHIALISNSDSHSLQRIGREANAFDTDLSYDGIITAIKDGARSENRSRTTLMSTQKDAEVIGVNQRTYQRQSASKFLYTIEFFPEEGKYHYDGHRLCGMVFSPAETKKHNGICPKCGRKLTVGVMNRVEELADRPPIESESKGFYQSYNNRVPYYNLIPLDEIIADVYGLNVNARKVKEEYENLIKIFGNELKILLEVKDEELKSITDERVRQGIKAVRERRLKIYPGFDGQYGKIEIFSSEERKSLETQKTLF